jgi:hypothetical protein
VCVSLDICAKCNFSHLTNSLSRANKLIIIAKREKFDACCVQNVGSKWNIKCLLFTCDDHCCHGRDDDDEKLFMTRRTLSGASKIQLGAPQT